jgi:hypothetical protein
VKQPAFPTPPLLEQPSTPTVRPKERRSAVTEVFVGSTAREAAGITPGDGNAARSVIRGASTTTGTIARSELA